MNFLKKVLLSFIIKGSKMEKAAGEFVSYVKGPRGKAILKKYGFSTAD